MDLFTAAAAAAAAAATALSLSLSLSLPSFISPLKHVSSDRALAEAQTGGTGPHGLVGKDYSYCIA